MKTILAVIGAIALLLVLGLLAVCNDDENEADSWARIQVASHDYDGDPCWDYGDCGDGRGGYDERNGGGSGDGRGGDGRFGGGRSGDYDGGPGDDCRNACGNTIIVPMPGEGGGGGAR